MNQENISAGEFTRWLEDDREFKREVRGYLVEHGERIVALETVKTDAGSAAASAASSKKWAVMGTVVGTAIGSAISAALAAFKG